MIPTIADGLCALMVLVLILEAQATYPFLLKEQFFQPLANLLIPALKPVCGYIVKRILFDIDIEGQLLSRHMRRPELRAFCFIVDDAHRFVDDQLIRHCVFNEISADELPDVPPSLLGNAHQGFLFRIRKQHITDDVIPVVMPGPLLLHALSTCTFP